MQRAGVTMKLMEVPPLMQLPSPLLVLTGPACNLRGAITGFSHGVHDPSYGQKSSRVKGNNPNITTRRNGMTRDIITTNKHPNANEKTGILGRDANTVHSRPNHVIQEVPES
jgi:hypothetical protein